MTPIRSKILQRFPQYHGLQPAYGHAGAAPTPGTQQSGYSLLNQHQPMMMAGKKAPRKGVLARMRGGSSGRTRRRSNVKPVRSEPSAMERRLAAGYSGLSRLGASALRLIWDPPVIEEPNAFLWAQQECAARGDTFRTPDGGWFRHDADNPVTRKIIDLVRPLVQGAWAHDEDNPRVVGVGSGAAILESVVASELGIHVLATDLFPPEVRSRPWQYQDLRNLSFAPGSIRVMLSSHALEYARPQSLAQAARVLDPKHGVLIAYVHHRQSSIVPAATHPMVRLSRLAYHVTHSVRGLRALCPSGPRLLTGYVYRLYQEMQEMAFADDAEIQRSLRAAGFRGKITIETPQVPPIMNFYAKRTSRTFDSGKLVVARMR